MRVKTTAPMDNVKCLSINDPKTKALGNELDTNYQLTYTIQWTLKCTYCFMWRYCYLANGLNIQTIINFLTCASNIFSIICTWEID